MNSSFDMFEEISDFDFWVGNGSFTNPFRLEGQWLYTEGPCITVEDTSSFFELVDCVLISKFSCGILISNASNGNIMNCNIKTGSIISSRTGKSILIENSSNIRIEGNIIQGSQYGISLESSQYCIIVNNIVTRNNIGLHLSESENNTISRNRIHHNTEAGISITTLSVNNIISENYLISNNNSNAIDDGIQNFWMTNSWSDYEGVGTYEVPGNASSMDANPSDIEGDIVGPDITYEYYFRGLSPFSTLTTTRNTVPWPTQPFSIILSDQSEVDTVLFVYLSHENTREIIMEYSSTEDKYQFVQEELYTFSYIFYYWANDTYGNWMATPMNAIYYNAREVQTEPEPFIDPDLLFAILGWGGVVLIFTICIGSYCILYRRTFRS